MQDPNDDKLVRIYCVIIKVIMSYNLYDPIYVSNIEKHQTVENVRS